MIESICETCVHKNVCRYYEPDEECRACNQFIDKSRCIELPCKVGDKVYWYNIPGEIIEAKIIKNGFCAKIENGFEYDAGYDEIGKIVFLTREEAEAALKGMAEGDHETLAD